MEKRDHTRIYDWQGRIDAVEDILSYVKSEVGEVVAAVKELQDDESADVRLHAFYALCHLGADAEAVVPTLVEHLRGGDESLRDIALEPLPKKEVYAHAAAVPYLIVLLTDHNSDDHHAGARSADANEDFIRVRNTRSCGRFGPAKLGSTSARSSETVSLKSGSGIPSARNRPCSFV